MLNVQIIIMQSLNIRNENCWSYRLHKPDSPYAFRMKKKCLSSTPVKNEKIFIKCALNGRCTSTMCAIITKFENKGMKTGRVTDYTNQTLPTHFGWKKCLSSTPIKNEKIFIKCA